MKDAYGKVEKSFVSDYVRLCFDEGIKPAEAFKETKRKLIAAKALKKRVTIVEEPATGGH